MVLSKLTVESPEQYEICSKLAIKTSERHLSLLTLNNKYWLGRNYCFRVLPHSDWIWSDTEYHSVFSWNAGKYEPEKHRIRTLHAVLAIQVSVILNGKKTCVLISAHYVFKWTEFKHTNIFQPISSRSFFLPLENIKILPVCFLMFSGQGVRKKLKNQKIFCMQRDAFCEN